MPSRQVKVFQALALTRAAMTTVMVIASGVHHAGADGLRDGDAEDKWPANSAKPHHPEGQTRGQGARGDDGGDGVGAIVEAVEEAVDQRASGQDDRGGDW